MRFFLFIFFSILVFSCKPSFDEPVISLDAYKIEDGFELKMVASEPLLTAPVAMDFDDKGRIWVVEMRGFMQNIDGTGEEEPSGSIKILEDLDNDGLMDHTKVFLDSLVMPRALALAYGGILYAEPPYLYFAEIENDKPVNRIVVDSLYAAVGNPEHQPNGLRMNIDNWIYNAKSHFRYQRKNGKWVKEPTTFRGQWGISQDNFGRLYFNNNGQQLLGDHVLPNLMIRNKYNIPRVGVSKMLTTNQRVYPLHAAAVNRGYEKGVLDKDSLLTTVTAACGPLVYRGGLFPDEYNENVFVCIPEANLIKRNILTFKGDKTESKQAWDDKEFLASTEEGFRPVNLFNGPDGAMYIVDMHRGVIGHHAYLSPYLKRKIEEKKLDTILDFGRILKIKTTAESTFENIDFDALSSDELVAFLSHKNGWIRDRAQHHLVFKNKTEAITKLDDLVTNTKNPITQLHALHTLNGLEALNYKKLTEEVISNGNADVVAHALVLLQNYATSENASITAELYQELIKKNNKSINLYLALTVGAWTAVDSELFLPIYTTLAQNHAEEKMYEEALLSGSSDIMETLEKEITKQPDVFSEEMKTNLSKSLALQKEDKPNYIFTRKAGSEDNRTKGAKLFRQICVACHGAWGEGIDGLAPPLKDSEYLSENVERLGLVILHGLKGPVNVNGKEYNFNSPMPGLASNHTISDKDISDIIAYITNAFADKPKGLSVDKIKELRAKTPKDGASYTEEELLKVFN